MSTRELNVGGDPKDPHWRYKMPSLVLKEEGRGNGKKTVIVNIVDVAEKLHIRPAYIAKFFGFEGNANSTFTEKTGRAVMKGWHTAAELQQILEKLIHFYILCPNCGYPELNYFYHKADIELRCRGCGYNNCLNWDHKLVRSIIKENKPKKGSRARPPPPRRPNPSHFSPFGAGKKASGGGCKARKKKVPTKKEPALGVLQEFLKQDRTADQIFEELRRLQISRSLDEQQKTKVLLEALIDTSKPKEVPDQYIEHAATLRRFADNKQRSDMLIYCIEEQVGLLAPKLLSRIPIILKNLYDTEVLDEEYIIDWAESAPETAWLVTKDVAIQVREKAAPFVDWLKDAEEYDDEGDEGDNSDEDDE